MQCSLLLRSWLLAVGAALSGGLVGQAPIDFARDVRPILSDRCFVCHGPDQARREAGLRLDQRDAALSELASGRFAIVPGKPAESELIRRVTAHGDERMPPAKSKLSVSEREVATLRQWIAEGAEYSGHWSFAPVPEEVAVPDASAAPWARGPVDAFVLAALQGAGMSPSEPADAAVWLRRAALSLTGLPPSTEQLQRFVADGDVGRAVDELLASPRYGERMASEWLDIARYADTFGYQSDVDRPVWPWRDWVIRAYNDNLPFDQFATWQIAGDLLPNATREQRLATAFNRLHRQTNEGGSVEEEMRLEYVADRTETFATAFLGLTVGCARCHDHKFDPIPTRDYYSLSAFFDNIDESGLYSHFTRATPTPALSLSTQQQRSAEDAALAKVQRLEKLCKPGEERLWSAFGLSFLEWVNGSGPATQQLLASEIPLAPVGSFALSSTEGNRLVNDINKEQPGKVGDSPSVVDGKVGKALRFDGEDWAKFPKIADFDRHQAFSFAFWLNVPEPYERAVVLHRSKAWTDAGSRGYEVLVEQGCLSFALVHFWPGNAIRVRCTEPLPVGDWNHVAVTYDGSSRAGGMTIFVNGSRAEVAVVRDALTRTIRGGGADALTLAQRFRDRGLKGGSVDELKVFARELTGYEVEVLAGAETAPEGTHDEAFTCYLRAVEPNYRKRLAELCEARRELGKIRDAQREIMVMHEMATPRPTFVRPRGSYEAQGERVEPAALTCLPPLPAESPKTNAQKINAQNNRLALARWLTDPSHPLTARVVANRIWQMHFGTGLVATPEDFGSQGAQPTHPDLLDYLARRLIDSGWDLKALHRLIVTSATFGQSSRPTAELLQRDPENRLLARGPRYQLPAEMLRDQALWAAKLLVEKVGGPPVRPYQPAGLWKEKSGKVYRRSKGEGLYRRSLYTFWKRTSPPPSMMLLDASKRDVCVMRRQSTSTPLQALLMLNDPQFVEASRVWAEQLVAAGGSDGKRLASVFARLTCRSPDARERGILLSALSEQREAYRKDPERAKKAATIGDREPAEGLDLVEVAAWTMVVSLLMNFDEVVRMR